MASQQMLCRNRVHRDRVFARREYGEGPPERCTTACKVHGVNGLARTQVKVPGTSCKADSTWRQQVRQLEGFGFACLSLSILYVRAKSLLSEEEGSGCFYFYPNPCREVDGEQNKYSCKERACALHVSPVPRGPPFSCHLGPFCPPAKQKPGFPHHSPGRESSVLLLTPCPVCPTYSGVIVRSHVLQMSFESVTLPSAFPNWLPLLAFLLFCSAPDHSPRFPV